ncbi:MAG: hypothetical protein GY698_10250 [Actinomycetia bacterium]|nr:hypothetical protein [Actinomycetes bacterium]
MERPQTSCARWSRDGLVDLAADEESGRVDLEMVGEAGPELVKPVAELLEHDSLI